MAHGVRYFKAFSPDAVSQGWCAVGFAEIGSMELGKRDGPLRPAGGPEVRLAYSCSLVQCFSTVVTLAGLASAVRPELRPSSLQASDAWADASRAPAGP